MSWNDGFKLNEKYREFILDSVNSTYVVAEGAWRAGKTVSILLSHILYLDDLTTDGLHIIAGESASTAKTIMLDNPSGYTYKGFFAERAKEGKFEGKDGVEIINSKGTKQTLIFVGAGKSNSWKAIRGITAKSVVITEGNIANPKFIEEAIGRTNASGDDRKIIMDLNPKNEKDIFYVGFLNVWIEKASRKELTLTYGHFTYEDNPGLDETEKKKILAQYDPDTLLYKAYILGMRVNQAENIFRLRGYNVVDKANAPMQYIIAVDPGISTSSTVFTVIGLTEQKQIVAYDVYEHKNGSGINNPNAKEYVDYAHDLIDFMEKQELRFGFLPRTILLDNDISFTRQAQTVFQNRGYGKGLLEYARKDKIDTRISNLSALLYRGDFIIEKHNESLIWAIENAEYDAKALEKDGKLVRLDEPKKNKEDLNFCDFLDPTDYAVTYFIDKFKIL